MLPLMESRAVNNTTRKEKSSMNNLRVDGKHAQGRVHMSGDLATTNSSPKVVITGDLRLRVTESYAGRRPVKGHYRIELEGIEEPLHAIWIAEGDVLNHTVHAIEVAFDVRGTPAGETLTRLLTAQVTGDNGRSCIVHSSVFVQISVVRDDDPSRVLALDNTLS
jgi:hypothetical protein